MRALILATAGFLAFAAQAEEIYKWTDKDGRVHYGDRPKAESAEPVATRRPGFDPEPVTEEQRAAAEAQRVACEEQTKKYEQYKSTAVIKQTDPFGETREFTPEEKAKFVELNRQKMKEACSGTPPALPVEQEEGAESGDAGPDDAGSDGAGTEEDADADR